MLNEVTVRNDIYKYYRVEYGKIIGDFDEFLKSYKLHAKTHLSFYNVKGEGRQYLARKYDKILKEMNLREFTYYFSYFKIL